MTTGEAIFLFFAKTPPPVQLTAGLQTAETCFLLIAMDRYPHALLTCAAATEAIIQSSPLLDKKASGLQGLISLCKRKSRVLAEFPDSELDLFRQARNRFAHKGFIPQDNNEAAALLLRVGLPFMILGLKELHSFNSSDYLSTDCAQHLEIAQRVYGLVRAISNDVTFCFGSFSHWIRLSVLDGFLPAWAQFAILDARGTGESSNNKTSLEYRFGCYWDFKCPVCRWAETAVTELSESDLELGNIVPLRLCCVECGFHIDTDEAALGQVLLEQQIRDERLAILASYGIKEGKL